MIDTDMLVSKLEEPLNKVERIYNEYNSGREEILSLEEFISAKIKGILNLDLISNFFSSVIGLLGNLLIAVFSIHSSPFFY